MGWLVGGLGCPAVLAMRRTPLKEGGKPEVFRA